MKVVILAGGLGTRLAEETELRPKPALELGEQPIIWHIMKHYSHYGFNEFFIALGYKGDVIKRFFIDYHSLHGNLTVDLANGDIRRHDAESESWVVHLMDTGQQTSTGGRLKRLEPWLSGETFMLTYGDGVSDVDLADLLRFHSSEGRTATVTAVRPPARFGELVFDGNLVTYFTEKPQIGEGWINGGFMVLEPTVFDYIGDDQTSLEALTLAHLARDRQLAAYRHTGFWQCMDTLREKRLLETLWREGRAPWKVWP
ncbi:MAG: glucose-1-phosphate cytidylyltransferase [Acidobacteria bacterium 21-70-11]|nr:MAG: glucose-1-phosphate cytidylyltransferase [Acidobacteria bacterium 21-70-11]HQT93683.1 glucose-1-phosphate cytidylyltransferase [Thermoanaerobaculaceae bacterium]HQU32728.1 glucose-1-phosphate cytidylyltransferase [Thermoanaerobaculaceae bacterium]